MHGPVLVFREEYLSKSANSVASVPYSYWPSQEQQPKYDVLASAEDVLNTWGPGQYVSLKNSHDGVQGGQFVLGQYNQTWCKVPGVTLKQSRLCPPDDLLLPFLESTWGFQVSFCTGVARRVTLRELVADTISTFAKTLCLEPKLWEVLETSHDVVDAFLTPGLREWWMKLRPDLQQYILKLVRRILEVLQETGIDRNRKLFTIAWPQVGDVQHCFKVPCEKESFWARMLANSEDCATFAYISPKCLESDKVKCTGAAVWRNASKLLETAVIPTPHQSVPFTAPWT